MNYKCNIAFLLLLLPCLPSIVCGENTDKELQKQLEGKLAKKPLVIRNFYAGKNLKYDSEGKLLSKEKPGKWTVDGCFVPDHVLLSKKEITLGGRRLYWLFDGKAKKPRMIPYSNKTTIAIERAPDCNTYLLIQKLIHKVFLAPDERLEDYVPSFWKNIIRTNFVVQPIDYSIRTLADGRIYPKEAMQDPQGRIKELPSDLPADINLLHCTGTVIIKVLYDEEGTARVQEILQPFGAGLDESVIQIIETRKFTPALLYGKPVKAFSIIELTRVH